MLTIHERQSVISQKLMIHLNMGTIPAWLYHKKDNPEHKVAVYAGNNCCCTLHVGLRTGDIYIRVGTIDILGPLSSAKALRIFWYLVTQMR